MPNFLIDKVMPLAPPSSWKVLCFIWRKTIGWNKATDFISLSQIARGAGVCRDTAIAAVSFWEQVGLIRRAERSGYRGTTAYEVVIDYDRRTTASRLRRLVEETDRSTESHSTSRKNPTPLVEGIDTQKSTNSKQQGGKQEGPAAFQSSEPWKALGLVYHIGPREFRMAWESVWSRGNGQALEVQMEQCITYCQDNDIKVPPEFYKLKRRAEDGEHEIVKLEVPA